MAEVQGTLFSDDGQAVKRCTRCGEVKQLELFHRNKNAKGGRHHYCGECSTARQNRFFHANKDRILPQMRQARFVLRTEMLAAYGNKCECCGESESGFLTLDHVLGGGKHHQKKAGGSKAIMLELKKAGWPLDEYRLLCWNCNCGRQRLPDGVCPHHLPTYFQDNASAPCERSLAKEKQCPNCQEVKNIDKDFGRNAKGFPQSYCRVCAVVLRREQRGRIRRGEVLLDTPFGLGVLQRCPRCDRWKNTTESFHQGQAWCKLCTHAHRQLNAAAVRERDAAWGRRQVLEMVAAYGGSCCCCGLQNPGFLTIDHTDGNGAEKRRNGDSRGVKFYSALKKRGYPKEGYRLMCFNCNCSRKQFGVCPHDRRRQTNCEST